MQSKTGVNTRVKQEIRYFRSISISKTHIKVVYKVGLVLTTQIKQKIRHVKSISKSKTHVKSIVYKVRLVLFRHVRSRQKKRS